jgi:hypothetical protein
MPTLLVDDNTIETHANALAGTLAVLGSAVAISSVSLAVAFDGENALLPALTRGVRRLGCLRFCDDL